MKRRIVFSILAVLLIMGTVGAIAVSADDAEPVATSAQDAPELKFYGAALVLDNTIDIRYLADVKNVSDVYDMQLLVWIDSPSEYKKGTENYAVNYAGKTMTSAGVTYPCFDFQNAGSKRMTDNFYAVLYLKNADGEYYSTPVKYSILNYAYNKLGKTATATTDTKLKNLLDSMLVYGAMSQEYLSYNTDRLATDDFYQIKVSGGLLPDGFNNGLYLEGESVTVSAPAIASNGDGFVRWENSAGEIVSTEKDYTFAVGDKNETYTAVYECIHQGEWVTETPATCIAVGLEKRTCTICSEVSEREIPIDSTAHNIGGWQVANPATCTESGTQKRECLNGCGKVQTRTIVALGHSVSTEYTYNSTEHWHPCTNSGCTYVEDKGTHTFDNVSCTECGVSKWGSMEGETDTPVIPLG